MASYLLKRLLLTTAVLWFIATLIFLLSRLMPGTFGSEQLAQTEAGFYSKSDANTREKTYRQFLEKTGQHLPLFYFSVSPLSEPDSLHRVYPESERQFLKRLSWQYGDWTLVASFYKSLKLAERTAAPALKRKMEPHLQTIYHQQESSSLKAAVAAMASELPEQTLKDTQLQQHTAALLAGQRPFGFLLPSLRWHGTANQYHRWLSELTRGELGTSFRERRPVATVLFEAIGNTWWLLLISLFLATVLALELAVLMVRRNNGHRWRKAVLPSLFLLDSVPLFVLAILLLVLLASPAFLQLFPVYGMGYFSETKLSWWQSRSQWLQFMALPMLSLVLANLPYLTNQFYHALSSTAKQDYVRMARAKGLSENSIIRRHMLRNALLPIITLLSDFLPALVAGAVIIETIFAIPGVGRLLIDSVMARDYPVILGIVVLVAVFKLLAHLVADLLYSLADPRIGHATT